MRYFGLFLVLLLLNACSKSESVNPQPVPQTMLNALDDSYNLGRSALLDVSKDAGILSNDKVPANFELRLLKEPDYGRLELRQDGSFSYQHDGSEASQDGFSYGLVSAEQVSAAEVVLKISALAPAEPGPSEPASLCPSFARTNEAFECQLAKGTTLQNAPMGMVIHERSGLIRWTPATAQTGTYSIMLRTHQESLAFSLNVEAGEADPVGIYVAPEGDDANTGDASHPFKTLQYAVDQAVPGSTIFLRGGTYYHPEYGQAFAGTRKFNAIAKITTSGTQDAPITLRAHGNEFAKLKTDEDALIFVEANNWIVDGLELEGSAQSLNYDHAMASWWTEENSQTTGRGISNRRSQHLTVRNSIIHDFPGAGIGSNGADFVTVENNIIFNNGWWSTAGTHGVANSYLTTLDPATADQEKLIMTGNLVFANQSLIISHVFSKGKVALVLDEGNGLHAQNNRETLLGKARVENNLLLFNGKAGFGINTMDAIIVRNNSFYQNARVVDSAGELSLQSSASADISDNLFLPRENRPAIKDFQKAYINVGANMVAGPQDSDLPASVSFVAQVFRDPTQLDFRPAAGVPSHMGVPEAELARMFRQVLAYGIELKAPEQVTDEAYIHKMKAQIFATWPDSHRQLILEDKASGFNYRYEQRCHYPALPSEEPCPEN